MSLFHKNTAGYFDELDPTFDNTGFSKIHEFGSNIHSYPFLFKHNHLTSIAACVNSKSIPANPITVNV